MKRNFQSMGSFPSDTGLLSGSTPSSNASLLTNLNHINGIRSNLAHFNGLVNQSVNMYGPGGLVGCPTINPYLLVCHI